MLTMRNDCRYYSRCSMFDVRFSVRCSVKRIAENNAENCVEIIARLIVGTILSKSLSEAVALVRSMPLLVKSVLIGLFLSLIPI